MFMLLCLHGHCDLSALRYPVNYNGRTSELAWWKAALSCFPCFDSLNEHARNVTSLENPYAQWQAFPAPITWLSVMLVRSAANISATLDTIAKSNFFHHIDYDRFYNLPNYPVQWIPKPDVCVATSRKGDEHLGLMLPDELDLDDPSNSWAEIQTRFFRRFNSIEEAFEVYFEVPEDQRSSMDYQNDREEDQRDWQPLLSL